MSRFVKYFVVGVSLCVVSLLLLGSVLGQSTTPDDVYRHLTVYTDVLSRIKSEYVEEPDMQGVTLGALNGLLESVDPYASYLDADQYTQYERVRTGEEAGVGLVLSRRVGYVTVVDAIPGSPAGEAGLTTGDMIETIDGVATRDMPLAYAEILLRGSVGSDVVLTVLRVQQGAEPHEVRLRRAKIDYPAVTSQMLPSGIGHVKVRSLESGKSKSVAAEVRKLAASGAERIILDLRRSSTGDPEEGLELANLFLDNGLLAYLEGQKVTRKDFSATRESTISRLPMVVVVNRGTARGAEIAAAALLDNDRCEVVGERSYGDAALRDAVKLTDGGAVILSVAKYYSPNGIALQDAGVTPSVVAMAIEPMMESEEDAGITPQPEPTIEEDTILQRAIEVVAEATTDVARESEPASTG